MWYLKWLTERPEYIPDVISNVEQPGKDIVALSYRDTRYRFSWADTSDSHSYLRDSVYNPHRVRSTANLGLYVDDQQVFALTLRGECDLDFPVTTWTPGDVEAFVEGPWVDELRALAEAASEHVRAVADTEAKKEREDPAKLADLKERFGVK